MIRSIVFAEELMKIIRQEILNGQHSSGEIIDEIALANRHEISRTPVREALKMLAKEGLVEIIPRKGCRVKDLTVEAALELYPIVAILESNSIAETCFRITDKEISHLKKIHEEMETACRDGDVELYYSLNMETHKLLPRMSGNEYLANLIEQLRRLMFLTRHKQLSAPGRLSQSLHEHRRLIAALEIRNPAEASRIMKEHVLNNWRAYLKIAGEAGDTVPDKSGMFFLECQGEWPEHTNAKEKESSDS